MKHNEFIQNAIKTESVVDELNVDSQVLVKSLEIFIEATEILDAIKKQAFYNNSKKMKNIKQNIKKIRECLDTLEFTAHHIENEQFKPENPTNVNTRVAHGVIGIATESGELVECFLNGMRSGKGLDTVNLVEEMFDGDWYKAVISDELDIDWEQSWELIINKLKARFGEKFSEAKANDRDTESERKILEGG